MFTAFQPYFTLQAARGCLAVWCACSGAGRAAEEPGLLPELVCHQPFPDVRAWGGAGMLCGLETEHMQQTWEGIVILPSWLRRSCSGEAHKEETAAAEYVPTRPTLTRESAGEDLHEKLMEFSMKSVFRCGLFTCMSYFAVCQKASCNLCSTSCSDPRQFLAAALCNKTQTGSHKNTGTQCAGRMSVCWAASAILCLMSCFYQEERRRV